MIYLVMHAYYSDWEIYGYFTTYDEAAKYMVKHPDRDLHIECVECYDGKEDLSNIKPRYLTDVRFRKIDGRWKLLYIDKTDIYDEPYLRSNNIRKIYRGDIMSVIVNTDKYDPDIITKIAQDLFYQYLSECNSCPDDETLAAFNKILSAEEDARKERERQDKIKQKELAELARLKAKYEVNNEED